MISINIFKVVANVGNLPLCSGVIAVQSGPKSHTFTVILAVFARAYGKAGIRNPEPEPETEPEPEPEPEPKK